MSSFEVKWCFSPHSTLLSSHFLWLWLVSYSLVMACSWFACQENTWALKEKHFMASGSEPVGKSLAALSPAQDGQLRKHCPVPAPQKGGWWSLPHHCMLAWLICSSSTAGLCQLTGTRVHWLWRWGVNSYQPSSAYRGLWLKACVCCCWEAAAGPMAQPGEADSCWTEQEKAQKHHHYK